MAKAHWLALPLVAIPCTLFAATLYVAVPIPTLGGGSTYGTAVNASGQVAGWADTDASGAAHRHAFLFSNGVTTNLGTLAGGTQSFAYAINDAGQVSGASNANGAGQLRAALFETGAVTDLSSLVGGTISNAYGINNRGDLAGATNRTGIAHGYLLQSGSGVAVDVGTFGGALSQAYGINSAGHVTGFAHVPSQDAHAFRYDGALNDLGTLGGKVSIGNAINVADHVVGQSSLPGDAVSHAFLHDGQTMIDLGSLGGTSAAHGVNAADTVVGDYMDAQGVSRAFVLYQGDLIDLNNVTSGLNGALLSTATAINDSGQIVAMSCTGPLVCPLAFRLDPAGAVKMQAIEYHHAEWDHYFMTAIPDEIAKLDAGMFAGWTRTGMAFNVWVGDQVATSPVCRFFSTAFDPKSSHFYTPFQGECVSLQRGSTWQFEARVFNITVPDDAGNCPAETLPVYRLYNQGMGAAPNHRYTTSLATRTTMVAAGWVPEGLGPDAVEMCSPL
jgi:probable HAF family extracellular repeat protein